MCGVLWNRSQLRRRDDGLYYCPDDDDNRTAREKDRAAALQRRARRNVFRDTQPRSELNTYEAEEGALLNFVIARTGPGTEVLLIDPNSGLYITADGTFQGEEHFNVQEAARYLYNLIKENKRPTNWITRAKTHLRTLADMELRRQYGSATAASAYSCNTTDVWFGGVTSQSVGVLSVSLGGRAGVGSALTGTSPGTDSVPSGYVASLNVASAGLTLLFQYDITGESAYLTGARNAATCLRRFQCGDLLTTGFASSDVTGLNRWHSGMWAHQLQLQIDASFTFEYALIPGNLLGVEFLNLLRSLDGDGTYGDTTAVGSFIARTDATLSTMISEAVAFWQVGAYDTPLNADPATAGQVVTAFSTTHPKTYYAGPPNGGNGSWGRGIDLSTCDSNIYDTELLCLALRSLYPVLGYAGIVKTMYDWLRSAGQNPNHVVGADLSSTNIGDGYRAQVPLVNGTFDPNLCPPSYLHLAGADLYSSNAALTEGTCSEYFWESAGFLAQIQAAVDPVNFQVMKDYVSTKQPFVGRTGGEPAEVDQGPYGAGAAAFRGYSPDFRIVTTSGYSGQTARTIYTPNDYNGWSACGVSTIGNIYRYSPNAFQMQS